MDVPSFPLCETILAIYCNGRNGRSREPLWVGAVQFYSSQYSKSDQVAVEPPGSLKPN